MFPPILHPLHLPYTHRQAFLLLSSDNSIGLNGSSSISLNTDGYGKFYCCEIVAVYQHEIHVKWSDTSKLASRAIISKIESKQQLEGITEQELKYLQNDSSLHHDDIL